MELQAWGVEGTKLRKEMVKHLGEEVFLYDVAYGEYLQQAHLVIGKEFSVKRVPVNERSVGFGKARIFTTNFLDLARTPPRQRVHFRCFLRSFTCPERGDKGRFHSRLELLDEEGYIVLLQVWANKSPEVPEAPCEVLICNVLVDAEKQRVVSSDSLTIRVARSMRDDELPSPVRSLPW